MVYMSVSLSMQQLTQCSGSIVAFINQSPVCPPVIHYIYYYILLSRVTPCTWRHGLARGSSPIRLTDDGHWDQAGLMREMNPALQSKHNYPFISGLSSSPADLQAWGPVSVSTYCQRSIISYVRCFVMRHTYLPRYIICQPFLEEV